VSIAIAIASRGRTRAVVARTVVRFVALATHRRVGTERFIVVVVGIVRRTTRAPWCDDERARDAGQGGSDDGPLGEGVVMSHDPS